MILSQTLMKLICVTLLRYVLIFPNGYEQELSIETI